MPLTPLLWQLALLTATVAAVGCNAAPGDVATLEFWAMGREGEVVEQMIPDFESRNPGVRVLVQQIPWSAAHEKLLTAYVGDSMPDVFQAGNTWLPEFVALGALEPLDAQIASSPAVRADNYFEGIWQTNFLEGRVYGIPWYVDTRVLFYRTDILKEAGAREPPRTWRAWLDLMTRIQDLIGPGRYAVLLPLREWETLVILALQRGAELLRDRDRYGNFRSALFRDALDFYVEMFRRGLTPVGGGAQIANLYQDFASGFFCMYVTGPWNLGEFQRRLPASMKGKWSTAPLPSPGEEYPGVSLAGGASLVIYRGSPRKEVAWRLIEYLSHPARQVDFYRLTGDLPSQQAAWKDPALTENPQAQAFWAQLQNVRSTPKIPEWERIANKIGQYAEAVVRKRMTINEALGALDADAGTLLEKRRWMMRSTPSDATQDPQ